MPRSPRALEYARLLADLDSPSHREFLATLSWDSPAFRAFATWSECIDFMRATGADRGIKNSILHDLVATRSTDRERRCISVLLALMWPGLMKLSKTLRQYEPNSEERWAELSWSFLRAIDETSLRDHPRFLANTLLQITRDRFRSEYRRRFREQRQTSPIPSEDEWPSHDVESPEAAVTRLALHQVLDRAVSTGRISSVDRSILVGRAIQGLSFLEISGEIGLSYEATKRRYSRALRRVREGIQKP